MSEIKKDWLELADTVLEAIKEYDYGRPISFRDIQNYCLLQHPDYMDIMIKKGLEVLDKQGRITHEWKLFPTESEFAVAEKMYKGIMK